MDNMEKVVQQLLAQMNANAKANQEDTLIRMKADKEDMLKKMAADKEDFSARMDAYHEKRMAMLDTHQKRMKACFGQTEATDFRVNPEKTETNPKENEAVLERQRVHNEETAIHSLKAC
jgi:hypothetical protein